MIFVALGACLAFCLTLLCAAPWGDDKQVREAEERVRNAEDDLFRVLKSPGE